jgi:hypothetical protein
MDTLLSHKIGYTKTKANTSDRRMSCLISLRAKKTAGHVGDHKITLVESVELATRSALSVNTPRLIVGTAVVGLAR